MSVSYRRISCAAMHFAAAVSCWLGTAGPVPQAATFNSGDSHVLTSSDSFVDVRDGGIPIRPTRLTVETGGNIAFLNVFDTSITSAQGGSIGHIVMSDSSHLVAGGTTISHVNLLHSSTAAMLAGRVEHFRAYDQSNAAIHGGMAGFVSALGLGPAGDEPATMGFSRIDIIGGSVGVLRASVGGVVNLFGGTVVEINPSGGGTSNVYGGTVASMTLSNGSVTNVFGQNFKLAFIGMISNTPQYRLTGTLSDRSALSALVLVPSGAVLRLVPEPANGMQIVVAIVVVGLGRTRHRIARGARYGVPPPASTDCNAS